MEYPTAVSRQCVSGHKLRPQFEMLREWKRNGRENGRSNERVEKKKQSGKRGNIRAAKRQKDCLIFDFPGGFRESNPRMGYEGHKADGGGSKKLRRDA